MIDLSGIPHKKLRPLIEEMRNRIKNHTVVKEVFDKYNVDLEELQYVPICFANLDVSAKTDHCVIYLNIQLLEDGSVKDDEHYLVHELTHWLQQSTGNGTKGSNSGDYLDNKEEVEGFKNQTEYMSDTQGKDVAEEYVDGVLDHHSIEDKEKNGKKKELLGRLEEFKKLKRI